MDAQIKWNSSNSRQVPALVLARPRWKEVRQGLMLALVGNLLALVLGPGGLILLVLEGGPIATRLDLSLEAGTLLGATVAATGALFGYALVLAGQWRCLLNAPQGHGAKDILFACLFCTLVAPVCFIVAHFLGGSASYAVFERGPRELRDLDYLSGGVMLQMAGLILGLGSVVMFSAFARAVSRCLNDAAGSRGVTCYFWFGAFLVGATIGLTLEARGNTLNRVLPGLGLAWLLCLLWHTLLIHGAVRRIGRVVSGERLREAPVPGSPVQQGQVVLQAAAYLHRGE